MFRMSCIDYNTDMPKDLSRVLRCLAQTEESFARVPFFIGFGPTQNPKRVHNGNLSRKTAASLGRFCSLDRPLGISGRVWPGGDGARLLHSHLANLCIPVVHEEGKT